MSASAQFWMDTVERVTEDFAFDRITREQALNKLYRLGFDEWEAADILDEAIS